MLFLEGSDWPSTSRGKWDSEIQMPVRVFCRSINDTLIDNGLDFLQKIVKEQRELGHAYPQPAQRAFHLVRPGRARSAFGCHPFFMTTSSLIFSFVYRSCCCVKSPSSWSSLANSERKSNRHSVNFFRLRNKTEFRFSFYWLWLASN